MLVEERVAYAGIIDWFKENILGVKPKVGKKEQGTQQKQKQQQAKADMMKNLLLFGGLTIVAIWFLTKGEQAKKQAVAKA